MNHAHRPSGDMAWDIVFMPAIKIEKPSRILPTPRLRSWPIIYSQMPMKPRIGLHAVGFIIFVRKLSPSKPDSALSNTGASVFGVGITAVTLLVAAGAAYTLRKRQA